MDNNIFDETPQKTLSFYAAIVLGGFFLLFTTGIDITEYFQNSDINIPAWFSYLILGVDFFMFLALVAIFFYQKIGVYAYPILLVIHLFLHEFYLSTLLYADLFNLFIFMGLGLLTIIPKWPYFK